MWHHMSTVRRSCCEIPQLLAPHIMTLHYEKHIKDRRSDGSMHSHGFKAKSLLIKGNMISVWKTGSKLGHWGSVGGAEINEEHKNGWKLKLFHSTWLTWCLHGGTLDKKVSVRQDYKGAGTKTRFWGHMCWCVMSVQCTWSYSVTETSRSFMRGVICLFLVLSEQ